MKLVLALVATLALAAAGATPTTVLPRARDSWLRCPAALPLATVLSGFPPTERDRFFMLFDGYLSKRWLVARRGSETSRFYVHRVDLEDDSNEIRLNLDVRYPHARRERADFHPLRAFLRDHEISILPVATELDEAMATLAERDRRAVIDRQRNGFGIVPTDTAAYLAALRDSLENGTAITIAERCGIAGLGCRRVTGRVTNVTTWATGAWDKPLPPSYEMPLAPTIFFDLRPERDYERRDVNFFDQFQRPVLVLYPNDTRGAKWEDQFVW